MQYFRKHKPAKQRFLELAWPASHGERKLFLIHKFNIINFECLASFPNRMWSLLLPRRYQKETCSLLDKTNRLVLILQPPPLLLCWEAAQSLPVIWRFSPWPRWSWILHVKISPSLLLAGAECGKAKLYYGVLVGCNGETFWALSLVKISQVGLNYA